MLTAVIALGGIGTLAAVMLGVPAKFFHVEVDPLVASLEDALPGANCGGCGYPGCSGAAEAMAKGTLPPTACVGGGPEVHTEVAAILGVEVVETEPEFANLGCRYSVSRADLKYHYSGANDCRAGDLTRTKLGFNDITGNEFAKHYYLISVVKNLMLYDFK
jgi:Na+-translocating ferredoxin:NAD+ oxidoreductase RNF subunit RnfB